jgi:hypothetical protein
MGPVEIEITGISGTDISVSTQYPSDTTPLRKRWRSDRSVIDGICADLDDILDYTMSEPLTEEEAGERHSEIEQRLKALGLALFQEILKEEGDLIREVASAPDEERYIIFKIDRSLAHLPVELMHDGEGFLSQKIGLGRVIYADEPIEIPTYDRTASRRVILAGDPSDDPAIRDDIDEEIRVLKRVFSGASGFSLKISVGADVDLKSILTDLPGTTVFHFTGHGTVSDAASRTGIRLGGDKVLSGQDLRGLQNPPDFAFLNICTAVPRSAWRSSLGLVETLLRRGTTACVASLWDLKSKVAAQLASSFYTHLLGGETFGHALRKARSEVMQSFGIHDMTWAAYTLYGDPRLTLLPPEVAGPRRKDGLRAFAAICGVLFLLAVLFFPVPIGKENLGTRIGIRVGYLVVESRPADATIFIDGEEKGVTPSALEIAVGSHHVVLQKHGYRRWEAWVEVDRSERTVLRPQMVRLE